MDACALVDERKRSLLHGPDKNDQSKRLLRRWQLPHWGKAQSSQKGERESVDVKAKAAEQLLCARSPSGSGTQRERWGSAEEEEESDAESSSGSALARALHLANKDALRGGIRFEFPASEFCNMAVL